MGLETATYISQLVDTNPTSSDPVSQGDDHLRLIKEVLQAQFTTLGAAAVTTTAAELNLLDGKTTVGDASGPGSSTDNAIARFNGTGGKTLQNSGITISDANVLDMGDNVFQKPEMKDYCETINAIGSITAGTNADLEDGNVQTVTFTANTFNFGITNSVGSKSNSLTLVITNGGLATVTWKSGAHGGGGNNVKWAGGSAPTLTNSGVDILCFTTVDGGTNFYGFAAGLDMS
jgi:hypothetical protein